MNAMHVYFDIKTGDKNGGKKVNTDNQAAMIKHLSLLYKNDTTNGVRSVHQIISFELFTQRATV